MGPGPPDGDDAVAWFERARRQAVEERWRQEIAAQAQESEERIQLEAAARVAEIRSDVLSLRTENTEQAGNPHC